MVGFGRVHFLQIIVLDDDSGVMVLLEGSKLGEAELGEASLFIAEPGGAYEVTSRKEFGEGEFGSAASVKVPL